MELEYCEPGYFEFVSYRSITTKFKAEISWANSPSDFFVNVLNDNGWNRYVKLVDEMQKFYNDSYNKCLLGKGTVGQLVAVLMEGKTWMRGCISNVRKNTYEIFIIDSGFLAEDVQDCNIRMLCKKFIRNHPAQAIPMKLAFVEPKDGSWANKAIQLIVDLLDTELHVVCASEEPGKLDGKYSVMLFDSETRDRCLVTSELIRQDYAEWPEDTVIRRIRNVL